MDTPRQERLNAIKATIDGMETDLATLHAQLEAAGLAPMLVRSFLEPLETLVQRHRADLRKLELAAALLDSVEASEQ